MGNGEDNNNNTNKLYLLYKSERRIADKGQDV